MPQRFPEYPDKTFLTFREVCDTLPEDAQKHLLRFGLEALEPYACWGSSPTPYVPRPVPLGWLCSGPTIEAGLLYFHSQTRHGHKGPNETLTLYFDKAHVEALRKAGDWAPHPDAQLPWFMADEPNKGGRRPTRWRTVVAEATAVKGSRLTADEALKVIEAEGVHVEPTQDGFNFDGAHVRRKTFTDALRDIEKRNNPKGE